MSIQLGHPFFREVPQATSFRASCRAAPQATLLPGVPSDGCLLVVVCRV